MNSPFAKLFLALQTKIAAITTGSPAAPLIPFIDQDLQQYLIKQRPATAFPAILIDFQDWTFNNMGDNCQTAEGNVVLTLLFAAYSNTSNGTTEEYKELALDYYEIENTLNKALHGYAPNGFGHLTRTSATPVLQRPDMRMRRITYRLEFEDYSTDDTQTFVHAPAVVTPEFLD